MLANSHTIQSLMVLIAAFLKVRMLAGQKSLLILAFSLCGYYVARQLNLVFCLNKVTSNSA